VDPRIKQLEKENARPAGRKLKQAETIIDVQKKLCDVLGLTVPEIDLNGSDE